MLLMLMVVISHCDATRRRPMKRFFMHVSCANVKNSFWDVAALSFVTFMHKKLRFNKVLACLNTSRDFLNLNLRKATHIDTGKRINDITLTAALSSI